MVADSRCVLSAALSARAPDLRPAPLPAPLPDRASAPGWPQSRGLQSLTFQLNLSRI